MHITLAFLGFVPTENRTKVENNVSEAIRGSKPFQLQINKLGIFGREEAPRVFWADVLESNELQLIRDRVFAACVGAGFKLETREFRPHITIARKWTSDEPFHKELLDILEELQPKPLEFEINNVVLYQTHLKKSPKYEVKTIFPLE